MEGRLIGHLGDKNLARRYRVVARLSDLEAHFALSSLRKTDCGKQSSRMQVSRNTYWSLGPRRSTTSESETRGVLEHRALGSTAAPVRFSFPGITDNEHQYLVFRAGEET